MSETLAGGCLCGAVRYEARGAPINVYVCHCRLCQKALGASFNVRALYPRDAVDIVGSASFFNSSAELARGFCAACGTTLFSERRSKGTIGITVSSLDAPDACPAPSRQIWTSAKQGWVCLDGLLSSPEMP